MGDVIYLDHAATSWPKPSCVSETMARFLASDAGNPGRAGHRMARAAESLVDSVRQTLTRFIHGTDPRRLIFTHNATDALNIAIKGLLRPGDHVITTTLEHNSVSRPLQALADAGVIELSRIDFSPATGVIDPDDIRRAIKSNTRLVAVTHASNVLGTIQPIAEVGRMVRNAHGKARFLVDTAQTIGWVPLDVRTQGIDLLAFPGHKALLGPTGTGGLYINESISIDEFIPLRQGGTGGDSASPTQPREFPHFLEAGTPNTVGLAGLGAALGHVTDPHNAADVPRERSLLATLLEALAGNPKCMLYGPTTEANRVGTVSFNLAGYSPQELAAILDESFHIAARPGLHCAPYAHRTLGTFPDGTLRVSFGYGNTMADVETLVGALGQL